MATEPTLCLIPSPNIARISSIIEYNKKKFCSKKLKSHSTQRSNHSIETPSLSPQDELEILSGLSAKHDVNEHYTNSTDFRRITFVDDWRRIKNENDMVPSLSMDKITLQMPREVKSTFRHLVRTIKFRKKNSKFTSGNAIRDHF